MCGGLVPPGGGVYSDSGLYVFILDLEEHPDLEETEMGHLESMEIRVSGSSRRNGIWIHYQNLRRTSIKNTLT